MHYALAIDMGASSGRHILGWMEAGRLHMEEVYRFPHQMIERNGHLAWDEEALFHHILAGMKQCRSLGKIPATLAIDTWGVDYRILDGHHNPLGDAIAYRDNRTEGMGDKLEQTLPFPEHYRLTGIAKQPFNTVYQLMAELEAHPRRGRVENRLLFLPCYFNYRLCGKLANEITIASTSGMMCPGRPAWAEPVLAAAGIPASLLSAPLLPPGTVLGDLTSEVAAEVGYTCQVMLAPSHDTASAFYAAGEAAGAGKGEALYLSSGTWSLLGALMDTPCLTEEARLAGFTNEAGVGDIRFLKNITGMWMLQQLRRGWENCLSYGEMTALARTGSSYPHTFDPGDGAFTNPASMEQAIRGNLADRGFPQPQGDGELLYCVHHSLANSYGRAVQELQSILQKPFTHLVVIGGGSQNQLVNELTARVTGMEVVVGETEASAAGNLMVQLHTQ